MSIRAYLKGAVAVLLSLAILGLGACGGGGSSGPRTSGLTKRAFVSDDFDGTLHVEDAQKDVESGFFVTSGTQPGAMALSPDKTITLVSNTGEKTLGVISNASESILGRIILPDVTTSFVPMSDNTVGFAAVPNCPPASCSGFSHVVEVVDLKTTFNITGTINSALDPVTSTSVALNAATTLVLSPTGNKLLVFGGPGEHADTMVVIDTATAKSTPASAATQIASPSLDRPVSAVFSSDGNTAFILNCGSECGGKVASISVLNVSANTLSAPIPVMGATTGLFNGSTLYVAGSPPGTNCSGSTTPTSATSCGTLQTFDTGTLTASASITITDGLHDHMELASNNQLFIGAHTCTNISTAGETRGCLTIFDTSKGTAVVPPVNFDVTGIAPINGRNIVYVVQGGELRIYDTTTDALTPTQIDVVGKAVDVKYVDK